MPDFYFWGIVWLFICVAVGQITARFTVQFVSKWFTKRKNNKVYDLYINDEYSSTLTYKECCDIYEITPFKNVKSCGHDRKEMKFNIHVDNQKFELTVYQ